MKSEDIIILKKIVGYCDDVESLMEKYSKDFELYCNDISFQYSCNMCIIQIGELVGRLSEDFLDNNKGIPWHAIKAMRNLHAHDYDNVDFEIVWNTLSDDIPNLKNELLKLI